MASPSRAELVEAVHHVRERLAKAEDAYRCDRSRSLWLCRDVMIARVEFEAIAKELSEYDSARDVHALYLSDRRKPR